MSGAGEPFEAPGSTDQSLGDLIGRLTKDFGDLVSTHIELAKVEAKEEAAKAGKGAGMFVGAAVAGLLTLLLLSLALAWGLDALMPRAVAFLIVGLLWAVVAGALAYLGRSEFQNMNPTPERTVDELKEDRRWLNEQKS